MRKAKVKRKSLSKKIRFEIFKRDSFLIDELEVEE